MPNILGKAFAGLAKAYFQAVISEQLAIIKANNPKEFYEDTLITADRAFSLLKQGTKNNKKVVSIAEIFTEPIEAAAEEDKIQL